MMRAEDVAQYLQSNPQFFEEHLETLAQITLPHPHGGRTISLSERQLVALREKNRELEKKLHELIEFARENDALQHKVHEFVTALFADTQAQPVCLHHAAHDTAGWFGEAAAQLHSFAYLPLHAGSETIGLLVLASEDR